MSKFLALDVFPSLANDIGTLNAFGFDVFMAFGGSRPGMDGCADDGLRMSAGVEQDLRTGKRMIRIDGHWITTEAAAREVLDIALQGIILGTSWDIYEDVHGARMCFIVGPMPPDEFAIAEAVDVIDLVDADDLRDPGEMAAAIQSAATRD